MHCFLLTNWVTVRAASSPAILQIVQGEEDWLDLGAYQDLVAWVDVRELTTPTAAGSNVFLDFQTSPVQDDAYFTSLINTTGGVTLAAASSPTVVRMTKDNTLVPLSKWLRWRLNTNGVNPTQTWDVTMRIWLAASYSQAAPPTQCACGRQSLARGGR
jgi:hypothetical protein